MPLCDENEVMNIYNWIVSSGSLGSDLSRIDQNKEMIIHGIRRIFVHKYLNENFLELEPSFMDKNYKNEITKGINMCDVLLSWASQWEMTQDEIDCGLDVEDMLGGFSPEPGYRTCYQYIDNEINIIKQLHNKLNDELLYCNKFSKKKGRKHNKELYELITIFSKIFITITAKKPTISYKPYDGQFYSDFLDLIYGVASQIGFKTNGLELKKNALGQLAKTYMKTDSFQENLGRKKINKKI